MNENALDHVVARSAIANVMAEWGLCRDNERWDRLRALFTADGVMHTTWFAGPASQFVDLSIEASRRGIRVRHFIGATASYIRRDYAVADTCMAIVVRATVAGTEVDVTCQGRFHDRLVREQGVWRICYRVPVYDQDRLDPVMPGARLDIDAHALADFPQSYRYLAYVQSLTGGTVPPGLPTTHSPEEKALHAESAAWLTDGH